MKTYILLKSLLHQSRALEKFQESETNPSDNVSMKLQRIPYLIVYLLFYLFQTEIAKRLSALINQLLPCLQPEHQQSVLQAVERAKQVTMPELNAIIGVSVFFF